MKNRVQINPTDGGSGADNTKVKNCGCQWNLKLGAQKVVKKSTKTSGEKVETSVGKVVAYRRAWVKKQWEDFPELA